MINQHRDDFLATNEKQERFERSKVKSLSLATKINIERVEWMHSMHLSRGASTFLGTVDDDARGEKGIDERSRGDVNRFA